MGKLADLLLFEEEHDVSKLRLYCDMDGVLFYFVKRFDDLFAKQPSEIEQEKGTPYFWAMIRRVGKKFWSRMDWTPNGQRLWNEISAHKPTLLTAPPKKQGDFSQLDPVTMEGKQEWADSNLSPAPAGIIFKASKDKQQVAQEDVANGLTPILIDDRRDIIERWQNAGGIGLHVEKNGDPSEAIQRIKKLYQVKDEGESSEERI
jgi:hypothetical protein